MKMSKIFLLLSAVVDEDKPALDYLPGVVGKLAAKGWINVIDGWIKITPIGRAFYASNKPL